MAETKKRIIQYNEELTPGSDDYLLLDSPTNGTRKILASNVGGGSGGGLDYSTEEQDTGTLWIDGKPRYQRTFVTPVDSIATGWQSPFSYVNWNGMTGTKVVKSEVIYERYNRVYSGFLMQFYFDNSTPSLYSPFSLNESGTLYVTVWYTKDSDSPVNETV